MTETSDVTFEVTMSGVLVSEDGEALPSDGEFEAALERLANALYGQVEDATVSGQHTTGEVRLWFSRPSELNPHSDLTWALGVFDAVLAGAGIAVSDIKGISHKTETVRAAVLA